MPSPPPSEVVQARHGRAGQCSVKRCLARQGMARRGLISARRALGLPCWVLRNSDLARRGLVGLNTSWHGRAWPGMAWADDLSTEGASPP